MSATAESLKAKPAAEAKKAEQPPKKSKKKLILIVAVLVLLIGGYEAKSILLAPHYKPGQAVPNGKILPLDQLTVNLSDGHMLQVSISLQLSSVAGGTVGSDVPRFDDAAITVFGDMTYKQLLAPDGKQQARQEILQACQKIAGTVDGAAPQINAVYYTGWTMQ